MRSAILAAAAASPAAIPVAAQLCGWAGGAVGVVTGWPQAWRLWVRRRHLGLSLSSNVLTVLFSIAWLAYGVASERMVQVVPALMGLTTAVLVLAGHIRLSRPRVGEWLPTLAGGTALLAAVWAVFGRGPLGVMASALTISGVVPQVALLVRGRRKGHFDASGVARSRWVLSMVCNGFWFGFGVLVGDLVVIANTTIISALSLAIVVLASGQRVTSMSDIDGRAAAHSECAAPA